VHQRQTGFKDAGTLLALALEAQTVLLAQLLALTISLVQQVAAEAAENTQRITQWQAAQVAEDLVDL
jgi:hypothetical protein